MTGCLIYYSAGAAGVKGGDGMTRPSQIDWIGKNFPKETKHRTVEPEVLIGFWIDRARIGPPPGEGLHPGPNRSRYGRVTRSAGLMSSRQSESRKARSTPGIAVERKVVS